MSPNKHNRKQRARVKNATNYTRERNILTLADDPASVQPSYLLPAQSAFSPALSSMFSPYQPHGQQPPGSSIPDVNNLQYQQSTVMHPFSQLQNSSFNSMQPFPHGQTQGAGSSEALSDLEKLRQLKSTILAGQHPFFQPVPNPHALESVYLGPHPASPAYQQQHNKSSQAEHGLPSQSQAETTMATQKPTTPSQGNSKPPQTQNSSSGPGLSRSSGSLSTSQPVPTAASVPSGVTPQSAVNGNNDDNSGRPHPSVIIPQKSANFGSAPPSAQPPDSARSQRGPSVVSGAHNEPSRMPTLASSITSQSSLNDVPGFNRQNEGKDSAATYREGHLDTLPGAYERERERPGYQVYDSRYSQASERRDTGRLASRHSDSRFDRDRDWDRDRERDREHYEREREREREKDRRRVDEKPHDDRRTEYERPGRPVDRRPSQPQASNGAEQKPFAPSEHRPVSGQLPEPPRSDASANPEQHPVIPHQEPQSNLTLPRPVPPPQPSSTEQHRHDVPGSSFSYPDQSSLERERPRFGPPTTARVPLPQTGTSTESPFPLPPSQSLRPDLRSAPGSAPMDDRSAPHHVPLDQTAPSGGMPTRSGPPSPESNRRPDSVNPAVRPPGVNTMPPTSDVSAPRTVSEQRLAHPGDPPPPPRLSSDAETRHGHEDRDSSRPYSPHPPLQSHRATPHPPSPGGSRRPSDIGYGDRDRTVPPSSYREPPPGIAAARGFAEDLRRQSLETSASRRTSEYYPPTPPATASTVIDRQNDVRQWRERESYPSAPYPGSDSESERVRRYPDSRDWHAGDPYGRERGSDIDTHPRGRPNPPASWDRERPIDKDKERDRYEGWNTVERKYPPHDAGPPPPRWEEPVLPPHVHRPPLHARMTDTYDERFIPAERARYPPPPVPGDDVRFRENPRLRARSPSPVARPPFDDTHRAKRPRDDYEPLARPPYYEEARRATGPPPAEYPPRVPPSSPPSYYDPRAPVLGNPRDPSPYSRERAPDPYTRQSMPPPRSPPFYARGRYPPR